MMTEEDVDDLTQIFYESKRLPDEEKKRQWLLTKFSEYIGDFSEEATNKNAIDVVYKLQKDCNLTYFTANHHCQTLGLEETRKMWNARTQQGYC